ncbi:hypothetical protein [Vulcanococcus limneticus]|uniref:hypothetical protein n=1 Tax=Vulcanococcus limneticus TaxID=2170428 RepID=UPI00398C0F61
MTVNNASPRWKRQVGDSQAQANHLDGVAPPPFAAASVAAAPVVTMDDLGIPSPISEGHGIRSGLVAWSNQVIDQPTPCHD